MFTARQFVLALALGVAGPSLEARAAAPLPDLELTPPSLGWHGPLRRALEFTDGQGGGQYYEGGRGEPGLTSLEFVVDLVWRLGADALAWDLYYGPDPGAASAGVLLFLLAPFVDALIVWGIGSISDFFFPRFGWTLLGAYAGSIVGGALFWAILLAAGGSIGAIVAGGILAAVIGAAVTVGVQSGTKWRRRRFRRFFQGPPPPPPPPYYAPVAAAASGPVRMAAQLPSLTSPLISLPF
ncbi:MAG: hypothetical protein ACYCWW_09780 [Deltaproteobacteria bacterium]